MSRVTQQRLERLAHTFGIRRCAQWPHLGRLEGQRRFERPVLRGHRRAGAGLGRSFDRASRVRPCGTLGDRRGGAPRTRSRRLSGRWVELKRLGVTALPVGRRVPITVEARGPPASNRSARAAGARRPCWRSKYSRTWGGPKALPCSRLSKSSNRPVRVTSFHFVLGTRRMTPTSCAPQTPWAGSRSVLARAPGHGQD